jgi:hypothetical protein
MDIILNHLECNMTLTHSVTAPRYISKNNGNWLFENELIENEVPSW